MKILLSAYACEPGKGSEAGVGWNWALELARQGHQVWVLTRSNNRDAIERHLSACPDAPPFRVLYCDLPRWASFWKRGGRGVYLYYFLWQWLAYRVARQEHKEQRFELVHHITFVSARQPSFMGGLGIPFIFGPVAGGEAAPLRLRLGYGLRGFLIDGVRDLLNLLVKIDPFMWQTFWRAERIFVTSAQTAALIPRPFRKKAQVQLAIGWGAEEPAVQREQSSALRVLYVGRFLFWKGMPLGLAAFARLAGELPQARLTLVGQGPEEGRWRALCRELGIEARVDWVPWVRQQELGELYARHHLLLFPSYHDSGGLVVLEALAHALPVVCLDLGGPGVVVDDSCGVAVRTGGRSVAEVVDGLYAALRRLACDELVLASKRAGALRKVKEHTWARNVERVYPCAPGGEVR